MTFSEEASGAACKWIRRSGNAASTAKGSLFVQRDMYSGVTRDERLGKAYVGLRYPGGARDGKGVQENTFLELGMKLWMYEEVT